MRRIILPLILVLLGWSLLSAQIANYYTFSSGTSAYTEITGTALSTILADNALSTALEIGFTFPYGLNTYTQVKMSSNGFLYLGTAGTSTGQTNSLASTSVYPVVAPLWDNLNLTGAAAAYQTEGDAPNRVFTAQWTNARWINTSTSTVSFQAKLHENGLIEFVYGTANGTPTSPTASIGINMAAGGSGNYLSVTPGNPASASSTVENSTVSAFPGTGVLYSFNPVIPAPYDLSCLSIAGNYTPTQGMPALYHITVRNVGANAASGYQVKLMSGDTELATVNGVELAPLATATLDVSWTPATQGDVAIHGKVVMAADTVLTNNVSPTLNVTVYEPGTTVATVGDGSQLARIPVDMYYRNSLFETIYMASELNVTGMLTGIKLYNNFVSHLQSMPTTIWLGMTTQSDLSSGWIASGQLTQVFTGTVDYPSGTNTVSITFQTPFNYTGNNLVMLVQRPVEALSYNSSDRFLSQTVGTNRSRVIYSSTTTYNPASPPATGSTLSGQFPKTSFVYTAAGTGAVFGVSPASKVWNNVVLDSSVTQTFVMYNSGAAPLTVNSITLSGSAMYELSNLPVLPLIVECGQSGSFVCTYHPTAAGESSAVITIEDNLGTVRNQHTVSLSGSCFDPTVYALPYEQSFDSVTTPSLPADWRKYVPATSNGSVTTVTSVIVVPYSTPNSADLYNNTDNAGTILLIAPPLAESISVPQSQIRFYARGYQTGYTLSVGVMSDPNTPESYQEVQSVNLTAAWTEYTVPLTAYAGTGRYITFKHGLGGTYRGLYVDDVNIEQGEITGNLEGHVYDANNQPVANALVQVGEAGSAIADINGYYIVNDLLPGVYQATASFAGYIDQQATVTITIGQTTLQDFTLPQIPTYNVSGTVVSSADPVIGLPGVNISLIAEEISYTVVSDELGQFFISGVVPNQTYSYSFHMAGYATYTGELTVGNESVDMGTITLNELAFPPASVTAVESEDGNSVIVSWTAPAMPDAPISSAGSFQAISQDTKDRPLTAYRLWRLQSGQENNEAAWTLLTTIINGDMTYTDTGWEALPSGTYLWAVKSVYSGDNLSVPAFSNTLVVSVPQIGIVSGRVANGADNTSIVGAAISSGEFTTTTDSFGNYMIILPTGERTILCSADGYNQSSQLITVMPGQQQTVNFLLNPTATTDPVTVHVTALLGNNPNPFCTGTTLSYSIKQATPVRVDIYNSKGQLVRTLVDAHRESGNYQISWDARDNKGCPVLSGIYFYKMRAGTYSSTRKMILLK